MLELVINFLSWGVRNKEYSSTSKYVRTMPPLLVRTSHYSCILRQAVVVVVVPRRAY